MQMELTNQYFTDFEYTSYNHKHSKEYGFIYIFSSFSCNIYIPPSNRIAGTSSLIIISASSISLILPDQQSFLQYQTVLNYGFLYKEIVSCAIELEWTKSYTLESTSGASKLPPYDNT